MTREEVAQLLYEVGFRDDDLVSMVAIAGRESSYDPGAHRTNRDPSMMVGDFGLFQINYINDTPSFRQAVGFTDRAQLLDPEVNARAAKHLFDRGGLAPWTAGPGGWTEGGDPLFHTDVHAAREAVQRAADAGLLGEDFDASAIADGPAVSEPGDAPEPTGPSQAEHFVELALAQAGDRYEVNATAHKDDPDPDVFDCSELVDWAAQRLGVPNPGEATYLQYNNIKANELTMSVEEALRTPGALLFRFPGGEPFPGQSFRRDGYHVAISLGDGRTIEAMGTKYGVRVAEADGRGFNYAGRIPGMDYGPGSGVVDPPTEDLAPAPEPDPEPEPEPDPLALAAAEAGADDSDVDMLPDFFELKYGLAADNPDTDGDGITDGYELIVLGTDASLADSDFDGLADGLEVSLGLDPSVADNPDLDAPLVAPTDLLDDDDGDGLADWGEKLAGTNPADPDSDDDGVLDGDELMQGTDPLRNELLSDPDPLGDDLAPDSDPLGADL